MVPDASSSCSGGSSSSGGDRKQDRTPQHHAVVCGLGRMDYDRSVAGNRWWQSNNSFGLGTKLKLSVAAKHTFFVRRTYHRPRTTRTQKNRARAAAKIWGTGSTGPSLRCCHLRLFCSAFFLFGFFLLLFDAWVGSSLGACGGDDLTTDRRSLDPVNPSMPLQRNWIRASRCTLIKRALPNFTPQSTD